MIKQQIHLIICLLILLSFTCTSVSSNISTIDTFPLDDENVDHTRIQDAIEVISERDPLFVNSDYNFINYEHPKAKFIEQYYPKDDDVELLWTTYIGAGEDEEYIYTVLDNIDSLLINSDNVPDILAGMYALDGTTGEIIYRFERGVFLGLGDVNNDGQKEIITGNNRAEAVDLFCLNASDGSAIWKQENIDGVYIDSVSIGDVTGDSTNEVVVGMDDVYCFNGIDGSVIWTKHLIDGWLCSIAISDVNNDGDNEILAGTFNNDARVCCLNGDNGNLIWEYKRDWVGFASFRTLCIDDLNDDPYQEIILEGIPSGSCAGLLCLSGYDGKRLWTWDEEPSTGSFQAILSADLIPSVPGKEIIAGGVGGIYCLYGGDNPPNAGRVIWHTKISIIMSAAVGDLDGDGLLDVVGSTCGIGSGKGSTYALKGQYGSVLWMKQGVGNDGQDSTICVDLNNDFIDEVVSLSEYYEDKRLYYVSALQSVFPSENHAPDAPIVDGPIQGTIRDTYSYSALSSDPDHDNLYYYFDWGDGTGDISTVGEPGESVVVSHSWQEEGTYIIKVKAIDEHGAESDWTTLEVSMPKNKAIDTPLQRFLNGHPYLFSILRHLLDF